MIPVFGDEKRRKINLGGASSATTHSEILDQARARRNERNELKRKQESATCVQSWWRGIEEVRRVRKEMRGVFEADITGLTGLRCLVLIGQDEDVLERWSNAMLENAEGNLFMPLLGETQHSWLVLIRQAALLLLRSVALSPQSPSALLHLKLLNILLSQKSAIEVLGPQGSSTCANITLYLINHAYYSFLSQGIQKIPVQSKNSPSLAPLITLATSPLMTLQSLPVEYAKAHSSVFAYILTIPLLPNRLPIETLPSLVSSLFMGQLDVLNAHIPTLVETTTLESKIHLIANLYMFISPHYRKLSKGSLRTYLVLLTSLFNSLPASIFESPSNRGSSTAKSPSWFQEDSGSETEDSTQVSVVLNFDNPPLPKLDPRTLTRLQKIPTAPHLKSLLTVSQAHPATQLDLIAFFLSLSTLWPGEKNRILSLVLVHSGGGLVRELYRGYVRRSPIGKNENFGSLVDPIHSADWVPLLFLVDLYTQSLLTMGDDEFFGTISNSAMRNPLTLDELVSFSRQLLNIAFALYWKDDQGAVQEGGVSGIVRSSWENIRDKVTKCLLRINARDARRSFVPADHWLIASRFDMISFIEAAVYEEQQLSASDGPSPRVLSNRQIALMSPRLGILNNIPFAIPFEVRVAIFRNFVMNDMRSRGMGRHSALGMSKKTRVQVRRGMVAQDGFDRLSDADLKAPIEISFIDQFGQEEAGIDGGGVFKEFFTDLCKEVFDTDRGLWLANKKNELYPNPHAYATESHSLNWYRFIGRILGKAMYEGILVDVAFAGFFLAKWLGKQSFLDDLASLDLDLYNGLIFLKHYEGNPEDLSLNFTVAIDEFGVTKTVDLCPNGSNTTVTRENRLEYILRVSHYRLSQQIKLQSEAFFEGLSEMINPKWLRMFNQQEVQILLGGVNSPIDLDDLRQHTLYGGLYDPNAETIVSFWNVVNTFDQEQRRALLRFVTSCSRPPLLGFKELVPNFAIRDSGSDQDRLPTASTCVNLLKLPRYTSERILRKKLLQAINSGAGFDLS